MKIFKYVSLIMISLVAMAGVASAMDMGDQSKVVVAPYGYANPGTTVQPYPQMPPMFPQTQPCQPQQMQPMYPQTQPCQQILPWQQQTQPTQNYNPCSSMATEYCTRWIAGHWVQVRIMVPGRWEYRPVWIPGYPTARYQWVKGFWQTTASNVRPDVYVQASQNGGFVGVPYQTYQNAGGGYFTPEGVWVPNAR